MPAINYAVTGAFEIGLRYWVSTVVAAVPGQSTVSDTVHSAGVKTMFRLDPTLLFGAEYSHGIQLDQTLPWLSFCSFGATS